LSSYDESANMSDNQTEMRVFAITLEQIFKTERRNGRFNSFEERLRTFSGGHLANFTMAEANILAGQGLYLTRVISCAYCSTVICSRERKNVYQAQVVHQSIGSCPALFRL